MRTEADRGTIAKYIFFKIRKKFATRTYFYKSLLACLLRLLKLLQVLIKLIDPQVTFTNPKVVYKSENRHQV